MKTLTKVILSSMLCLALFLVSSISFAEQKEVIVANPDSKPVPVKGNVGIIGTPNVIVVNPDSQPVPVSVVNGSAPGLVQYRVAGATGDPDRYSGDTSLHNLNRFCREQFNQEARMCTSEEVIKTPHLGSISGRIGWVQPLIGSAVVLPSGIMEVVDSASGLHSETLNCDNWSAVTGNGIVWHNGKLGVLPCDGSYRVICCVPTLVTAP